MLLKLDQILKLLNVYQRILWKVSDNHDIDENISFPFLKKIKSEHPKNLFSLKTHFLDN